MPWELTGWREKLAFRLDLLVAYEGAGLQSLESSADEDFLGSFASFSAWLIAFCRNADLQVYTRIAETSEALDNVGKSQSCTTTQGIMEVNERSAAMRDSLLEEESSVAAQLVRSHRLVEFP